MGCVIYTARRGELSGKLIQEIAHFLNRDGAGDLFIVVPNQLTLETETMLLDALSLKGSFRLNVVSPKRLCGRVFEECGRPGAAVIDERGRAMLMGYLLRQHEKQLKWYGSSASRAGFESRLVEEISHFRQAGIASDELKALSEDDMDDRMRAKLADLSLLYSKYEMKISPSVQDGEQEIAEAVARMPSSTALKNACAFVFGFDITTSAVNQLIAGLCGVCPETRVFLPLPDNFYGDETIYEPQRKALMRLEEVFRSKGIPYTVEPLPCKSALSPVERAVRRLFSMSSEKTRIGSADLTARQLKNPLDEARCVAASIRELVRTRGYRYSDISVIVQDLETHEDVIDCAFREYEVPYFSQTSMRASTHPLCRYLIESLALIAGKSSGAGALFETGFSALDQDEQEILTDYCERLKLRPASLLKPFTRGSSEMIHSAEPPRQKLAEPLIRLRAGIKGAATLGIQLRCVYSYLADTGCFSKYAEYVDALKAAGENALAQDEVRIGNFLIDTFDQMDELLGPEPLTLVAMADLLKRALDAVVVKILPQSPDAVQIASPQRCGMKPVKAVFLMHAVSGSLAEQNGIFDDAELSLLSQKTKKYLAPSLLDLARTDRMYVKDALCLASESVRVSFPSGMMDGSAQVSGTVIGEFKRLFSDFRLLGGVEGDPGAHALRIVSPGGALSYVSAELASLPQDAPVATVLKLMDKSGALAQLRRAAVYTGQSAALDRDIARRLYLKGTSISRLEKYAACPFSHFVEQGLRPQKQRAFQIDPLNRGILLHECVELFIKSAGSEAGSEQDAADLMSKVFDEALKGEIAPYAKDSGASLFQIKTLKRAAVRASKMLYRQLKTGVFHPVGVEVGFGPGGRRLLRLNENVELDGRIDRVDGGRYNSEKYVFVVDYKSGSKALEPRQILAGMQLQLLIYLAVAMDKYEALPAGAYYFRISDEPVKTESTDPDEIEKERTRELRMHGIAPDDAQLLKEIADEPQSIINVDFKSDGTLKSGGARADRSDFDALIRHAVEQCRRFSDEILAGNTSVSPVVSTSVDACKYCDYADICLKDRLIRGVNKRKLPSIRFGELLDAVRKENSCNRD